MLIRIKKLLNCLYNLISDITILVLLMNGFKTEKISPRDMQN